KKGYSKEWPFLCAPEKHPSQARTSGHASRRYTALSGTLRRILTAWPYAFLIMLHAGMLP
ncbi:hypothetical protein, partial [Pseudomonas syringae]|uniref:hypothetical protein n=1 Tax=Pseudomonas syringae TaxID=317 RepID=UPI001F2635AD